MANVVLHLIGHIADVCVAGVWNEWVYGDQIIIETELIWSKFIDNSVLFFQISMSVVWDIENIAPRLALSKSFDVSVPYEKFRRVYTFIISVNAFTFIYLLTGS